MALVLVPFIAPIIGAAIIAIIALDHYRPFYAQVRPGQCGRHFRCFKLQTMPPRPGGVPIDRIEHASSVTRLGALLRDHGIDELPQLVNVILGQMAVIGPRPVPIEHLATIAGSVDTVKAAHWIRRRQSVLPGITGWSQIHQLDSLQGRTVEFDLQFLDAPTLARKIRIVFSTGLILLIGKRRFISRPENLETAGVIREGSS